MKTTNKQIESLLVVTLVLVVLLVI